MCPVQKQAAVAEYKLFCMGEKVTKDGSDLSEMKIIDSGTTINLFGNPIRITNRQKVEIPINFLTNAGSKIVDEVGEIPGPGQTKFLLEMISKN